MNNKKTDFSSLLTGVLLNLVSISAFAADVIIGSVEKNGMEIVAVYIQPVTMEPMLPGMGPADMHLEADIHALKGNQHGYAEGDWIPYLEITYTISKVESTWSSTGAFMPMAAADGPHYANNIKLDGAGKYKLRYHIDPPPYNGFYRHTDKETGVTEWWQPFDLDWEFIFVGTGKKGEY